MSILSHSIFSSPKTFLYSMGIISLLFISPAFADTVKLVVLGDSLSAGYRLPRGAGFTEQLQRRLKKEGHDVTIINAGVSGDTTAGGLARLSWSVPKGTHAVIVELGANDALRGVDPKQTYKNLDKLIGKLRKRGIKVLLAGMEAPRNLGVPYVKACGAIYPARAKKYRVALYPFFLKGVALQNSSCWQMACTPMKRALPLWSKISNPMSCACCNKQRNRQPAKHFDAICHPFSLSIICSQRLAFFLNDQPHQIC